MSNGHIALMIVNKNFDTLVFKTKDQRESHNNTERLTIVVRYVVYYGTLFLFLEEKNLLEVNFTQFFSFL